MKRISVLLVLILAGSLFRVADASPKPRVSFNSTVQSDGDGCGQFDPDTHTCTRLRVTLHNFPGTRATGDLTSHASRNGPVVLDYGEISLFLEDGTGFFTFVHPCDEAAPWHSFDVTEPVAVESKVHKAC